MQVMVKEGLIRVQHDLREANTAAHGLVKPKSKTEFRACRDQSVGPFQNLAIKLSPGEQLRKRKLAEIK